MLGRTNCFIQEKLILAVKSTLPKTLEDVCAQKIFLNLAMQKGSDVVLPKRRKNWGSQSSFWREHAPKNTFNLKNQASLADKATVSVSPRVLQLDL